MLEATSEPDLARDHRPYEWHRRSPSLHRTRVEALAGRKGINVAEHLYRRGKIWWAWVYDANGDQDRFSTGCTDKAAARLVLAQKEREAADPDTAAKKKAILADAFDLLITDRRALVTAGKRSKRTLDFYDSHARPWYIFAGAKVRSMTAAEVDGLTLDERNALVELGRRVSLIDAADECFVDAFVRFRRELQNSEHCIHHDRQTFKTALGLAKRAKIWAGDVDVIFGRMDVGYEPVQHWITHEHADKLLAKITLPNRRAYVAFILATGAELAGVERARREDVTPRMVHVRGTKNTNRDRWVPIVTEWQRRLLKIVEKHADGKDGALFSTWSNALRSIKLACVKANVPHVSRHGLRHTFSAWMKAEGVPHSELYLAMGHADTTMLERTYGKPGPDELAKAMAGSIAVRRAALRVVNGGKRAKRRAAAV